MILSADSLTCQRGQAPVLRDVSFTLQNGEIMAVTGANGSGKSTLLRACAGLNDPVEGTIKTTSAPSWIGTHAPLKPTLTVTQNLSFWLALQGGTGSDIITRALHKFEIAHLASRRVSTLSSGQKQRVSLARLFLSSEKLWLLDEPESALDSDGRDMMRRALSEHCGDGGSALIATHNADLWSPTTTLNLSNTSIPLSNTVIPAQAGTHDMDTTMGPRLRGDDNNVLSTFSATLSRDLNLFRSSKADCLQPLTLFILMIVLFPLSLGPDAATLAPISGGLLMMAAFFASLLPLENIFTDDAGDSTIETIMTIAAPLPIYAAARMVAHWLVNGLSVTLLTPLALIMLGAPAHHMTEAILTILAATLLFTLIGASLSALVLSTHKGALLLALLAAPLYIPVLIFGSGALSQITTGQSPFTPLLLLWAMVAAFLPLAPLLASGCLRLMRD